MARPPHLLLVTFDQWPAALTGPSGDATTQTPTLDALARQGTWFSQLRAECPVCIPARRSLMTGTSARRHGDWHYREGGALPPFPHLAEVLRAGGYATCAVGKLHVFPQRARIGFDEVRLDEEGRNQFGLIDDYEVFLGDRGFAGQQFAHGLGNNTYLSRAWHLPEDVHPTAYVTREIVRAIQRRDPGKPNFWYASYRHPHPPLAPLQAYLDLYADVVLPDPPMGDWARAGRPQPTPVAETQERLRLDPATARLAQRAFRALCTHLDAQLRLLMGALREAKLLDDTIIFITADHGELLGAHGLWGKRLLYDRSVRVPGLLLGADPRIGLGQRDERLAGLHDVMPTLLDLAGIAIPDAVEGLSLIGAQRRATSTGIFADGRAATRSITDGTHTLIWYAAGNVHQLFDATHDREERYDLAAADPERTAAMAALLAASLHGDDRAFVAADGRSLIGLPVSAPAVRRDLGLDGQRSLQWPPLR